VHPPAVTLQFVILLEIKELWAGNSESHSNDRGYVSVLLAGWWSVLVN